MTPMPEPSTTADGVRAERDRYREALIETPLMPDRSLPVCVACGSVAQHGPVYEFIVHELGDDPRIPEGLYHEDCIPVVGFDPQEDHDPHVQGRGSESLWRVRFAKLADADEVQSFEIRAATGSLALVDAWKALDGTTGRRDWYLLDWRWLGR